MPPRAMASSVRSAMASDAGAPVRSWWRSRNSSTIDGGNFGAVPNPPFLSSNCGTSRSAAASNSATEGGPSPAKSGAATSARAETTRCPAASTSSRLSCQAWATAPSSWVNCARGKNVPAKNGSPSGVSRQVIGQPPCPVSAVVASM